MIIYIHGFNSSPASHKATQFREQMAKMDREEEFVCPALSHRPQEAMADLEERVDVAGAREVTLVGSSLGGFYATWLTEKKGCRSVLVNPAINPHVGLRDYAGMQRNLYTGEEYELTEDHLVQLETLYVPRPRHMDRYLLMHTTGDELLDWRVAVDRYRGCRQIVVDGGDHGFSEFGNYIDSVLAFAAQD